jgi:hypothetical protein
MWIVEAEETGIVQMAEPMVIEQMDEINARHPLVGKQKAVPNSNGTALFVGNL